MPWKIIHWIIGQFLGPLLRKRKEGDAIQISDRRPLLREPFVYRKLSPSTGYWSESDQYDTAETLDWRRCCFMEFEAARAHCLVHHGRRICCRNPRSQWLRSFISEAFGSNLESTTVFSDNQSAIALSRYHTRDEANLINLSPHRKTTKFKHNRK